jgi:hypothetical protein
VKCRPISPGGGVDLASGVRIAAVVLAAVAAAAVLASQETAEPARDAEVLRHISPALGR